MFQLNPPSFHHFFFGCSHSLPADHEPSLLKFLHQDEPMKDRADY